MMVPHLHHGMLLVDIPYTEEAMRTAQTGGAADGARRIAKDAAGKISEDERELARALGARVANIARKLA